MEKTNNNFKSALKRLEVEIDERNGQIRAQKTDIANLKVKLDQLPSILAANMVKTTQQLPQKKNSKSTLSINNTFVLILCLFSQSDSPPVSL